MRRIAVGDQQAFRSLYEQFATPLYRYALLRLRDTTAAEDVVQETLLAVWRAPKRFSGGSSLGTYLFSICHHKIVDQVRRETKQRQLEQTPHTTSITNDSAAALEAAEAIASLPSEMQSVLLLAFHYGLTYQEIAEVLKIPTGTVKSRVFQARQRLRVWLKEDQANVHT